MNTSRILSIIVLVLVLAALGYAAYYFSSNQDTPPAEITVNFTQVGTTIRNNPGFKPDVWYLSYEKPGQPALSVELDFNSVAAPYIDLTVGQRVEVKGMLHDSVVVVQSITPVEY